MKLSDPILRPPDRWTDTDWRMIQYNLQRLDRELRFLSSLGHRCGAPDCGFPLGLQGNLRVEIYDHEEGSTRSRDVCKLCYDMYTAISVPHFVGLHRSWVSQQNRIRRLGENS